MNKFLTSVAAVAILFAAGSAFAGVGLATVAPKTSGLNVLPTAQVVNPVKAPLLTPIPTVVAPTIVPASVGNLPAIVVTAPPPAPVRVTPPLLVKR